MEKNYLVKPWLTDDDIKFLIITNGRSDTISSHKLFPFATIVCPEEQMKDYEHCGLPMVGTPNDLKGIGYVRNWCLMKFASTKVIIMIDDDITEVNRVDSIHKTIYKDPADVYALIYQTAQCAYDAGAPVFSWNQQQGDTRKYQPNEPFSLNKWCGTIIGVIDLDGKGHRMFCNNKCKADIDYCLQSLLDERITWVDNRISFICGRDKNKGGTQKFKTQEMVDAEIAYLKDKWGDLISFKPNKGNYSASMKVKRHQSYTFLPK